MRQMTWSEPVISSCELSLTHNEYKHTHTHINVHTHALISVSVAVTKGVMNDLSTVAQELLHRLWQPLSVVDLFPPERATFAVHWHRWLFREERCTGMWVKTGTSTDKRANERRDQMAGTFDAVAFAYLGVSQARSEREKRTRTLWCKWVSR